MKLAIFKRTVYSNDYNKIHGEDHTVIVTTVKEAVIVTSEIRIEGRQTLPDKKEMRLII